MKAKLLASAALILGVLGVMTILVPVAPQVLYTPVITSYRTMTPYTVKYQQVTDDPHDSYKPELGDIEFVTYQRVGESLRINITLSQPLSGTYREHAFAYVFILSDPTGLVSNLARGTYWLVEFDRSPPNNCDLWKPVSFTQSIRVMSLEPCLITAEILTADVPLSAINYPTKIFPQASIIYYHGGDPLAMMPVDDAPDFNVPPPEVDLSPSYARTLTRTFATYSTHSSAYTVKVPLAVSVGMWVSVVILLVAGCLFAAAIYGTRTRAKK